MKRVFERTMFCTYVTFSVLVALYLYHGFEAGSLPLKDALYLIAQCGVAFGMLTFFESRLIAWASKGEES